jgi:Fe-S-cluster-containing dehydrogenase component/DMSO reductase anchor subunit
VKKNSFIFNTNQCVGCNACAVACSIENGSDPMMNWREVNTHNKIKHPGLPVFHFSLACNHCEEAPCMSNCPALAYSRDEKTGAIIHHAEACIGCTYCTWACPYDAPKFNPATKIVEKCNFCVDRISEGEKPACVAACPVGALDFGQLCLSDEDRVIPGFVDRGVRPSIQLIPLREENRTPQIENLDAEEISLEKLETYLPKEKSKVNLDKEWTLVLFTLAVAVLVSWQSAHLLGTLKMPLLPFLAISLVAIGLTSFHIGKKLRMWRFILNLKGSWLSREIVSFSAFLGFTVLHLITDNQGIGFLALAFGLFSLIAVDKVYQFLRREDGLPLHSAMVSTSAILFFACLADVPFLMGLLILGKGTLYIWRKLVLEKKGMTYFPLLSGMRILCLILPFFFYNLLGEWAATISFLIIFTGEIIDRAEFYFESDVITPEKELNELPFIKP